jgi:hypothetical protein
MFSLTYVYVQFGLWSIQFHIFGMWSTVYICSINSYLVYMWSVLFHILVMLNYLWVVCHTVLFKLNYDDLALCWRQFELLMVVVWSVFCCCIWLLCWRQALWLYFVSLLPLFWGNFCFCLSFHWYPMDTWYPPETWWVWVRFFARGYKYVYKILPVGSLLTGG